MSSEKLEDKLRKDFRKALMCNKCGDVVDDLISILKRDYILMVKEPLYCKDCFSCNTAVSMINSDFSILDAFCVYYQRKISRFACANDCEHYFEGGNEARKTMARMHGELTGDLFYE